MAAVAYYQMAESDTTEDSEFLGTDPSSTSSDAGFEYTRQSEKLALDPPTKDANGSGAAVEAQYITPQDTIIVTADGGRLPGVPLAEAEKLNELKAEVNTPPSHANGSRAPSKDPKSPSASKESRPEPPNASTIQRSAEGSLRRSMPPSRTHPLFPPLPLYGPSSIARDLQCLTFRASSFVLSLAFLGVIVLGSAFTSIPMMFNHIWMRLTLRNPDRRRPFYQEEKRRKAIRKEEERCWNKERSRRRNSQTVLNYDKEEEAAMGEFVPTEGGKDPIVCDVGYYARRVGLDMEEFKVQTEDGFIIRLWHIYNPREYKPMTAAQRAARGPTVFTDSGPSRPLDPSKTPKFPILMIHGLLQSAGAFCVNDDCSLAFYLCKAGYDVWLGNNRCGFTPEHTLLQTSDPRMWAWNIRQMGVMDLPALTSRVLAETGFEKLGLIAHSQGTTQTFVALAKEQRPELGDKLTIFCALAPAVYAGPLIEKAYLKFMRLLSPSLFRLVFGIHGFIPFMMTMHGCIPGHFYGAMGYRVFSFLFNWSDNNWDRGLRDRMFQFAPVHVSAESMRWWLGRECFAKQKCILATREEGHLEDAEDEMEDYYRRSANQLSAGTSPNIQLHNGNSGFRRPSEGKRMHQRKPKGSTAWYSNQTPPFALWVAGSDDLVDGRRLIRRFERGREPNVRVVHQKVIEEYEHLDVIWAIDCLEKVGREVKECVWKCCDEGVRGRVRVPVGCEEVGIWRDDRFEKVDGGEGEGEEGREDSGQSSSSEDRE